MFEYAANLNRIVDADTLRLDIDLGCGVWRINEPIRLFGINAPELSTEAGKLAKAALVGLFSTNAGPIVVKTIKDRSEKFGRLLGIVTVGGINLNDWLVSQGHAVHKTY